MLQKIWTEQVVEEGNIKQNFLKKLFSGEVFDISRAKEAFKKGLKDL